MVISLLIFAGLKDLRFCTRILDEINYSCDGSSVVQTEAGEAYGLDKVALTHVESVTVEHENQVQVSINKVMSYLKQVGTENITLCSINFQNVRKCEV